MSIVMYNIGIEIKFRKGLQTYSTDAINGRGVFACNIYLNLAGLSIKPRDLSILLALTALSTSLILIPLLLMMRIYCVGAPE